jgi:hypothetical protein
MRVELRPAVAEDIDAISADARPADVAEMEAMGYGFREALELSLSRADWALTATVDGVPVAMLGVSCLSVVFGEGTPWLLSANGVLRAQKSLLKTCGPVIDRMLASYPRLINLVDERNTVSIRWLRWLGFTFDEAVIPFRGHRFLTFRLGHWG